VDAWRTPARVVAADEPNEVPNFLRHAGPSRITMAHSPRPVEAKSFPVPSQRGLWFNDHQHITRKARSAGVSRNRFGADRRRAPSCCRSARFSRRSSAEVLYQHESAAMSVNNASALARTDLRRLAKPNHLRAIGGFCSHSSRRRRRARLGRAEGSRVPDTHPEPPFRGLNVRVADPLRRS
jgi:hypothetical protein